MPTAAFEASRGLIARLAWLGLLHSLWLGLLAAAIVALAFRAGPRLSRRSRHAILLAALLAIALGPAAIAACQHLAASRTAGVVSPGRAASVLIFLGGASPGAPGGRSVAGASRPEAGAEAEAFPARCLAIASAGLFSAVDAARLLRPFALAAWSLAVVSFGSILALGVRGMDRLRREAGPAPGNIQERARTLGRRLRLGRAPTVLVHPVLDEPCLCGVFRPAILLPGRWLASSRDGLLDAILAHELAHARRRDPLVNLAQRLLETFLFFHPGVHWLSGALRRERELCTDALAVRITRDPLALARALESVARHRLGARAPSPLGASLGGETASLLPRIQELIGMTPTRPSSRPPVWPFAAFPAAGVVALVAASVGLAQDPTLPTPPSASSRAEAATSQDRGIGFEFEAVVHPPAPDAGGVSPVPDRQIAYEVRFLDLKEKPWRDRLKGRLVPVERENSVDAWVIDQKVLFDLLTHMQKDFTSNNLQAPKVTSFENAPATIRNVSPAGIGWKVDVKGSWLPWGSLLSADLRYTSLPGAEPPDRPGDREGTARGRATVVIERRCRASCEVPEGSSLLISGGQYERRLERGGSIALERLVVITPRAIRLEPEERTGLSPADTAPSRSTTR